MEIGGQASDGRNNKSQKRETDLFLVLEGGGARGVAHIAAWRVLEGLVSKPREPLAAPLPDGLGPEGYKLSAVAGTSAGAIAAAFIAAGAKSDDLIDRHGRVPLCAVLGLEYFHDLFGARGWHRLQFWRRIQRPSKRLVREAEQLTPESEKTLRRSATNQPSLTSTLERRNEPIDPFSKLVLLGIGLFVLWELLDAGGVFKTPATGANFFLLFLILAYGFSRLWALVLRIVEGRKRELLRRHYSRSFRTLARPIAPIIVAAAITLTIALWPSLFGRTAETPPTSLLSDFVLAPALYGVGGGLLAIGLIVMLRRIFKGTVRTDIVEDDLDRALRTILSQTVTGWDEERQCHLWKTKSPNSGEGEDAPNLPSKQSRVSFRDLRHATGIDLSVVAADTIKNEVFIYNTTTHLDFPVAKAVAASLAIPVAFRPVLDDRRYLVDGGLVSSIPAWVYRRHRTRDPDCRILAIGIEQEEFDTWIPYFFDAQNRVIQEWEARGNRWVSRKLLGGIGRLVVCWKWPVASLTWPLRFILNVASTAMFGARALELDASDRLDSFPLQPDLRLLDFDVDSDFLARELSLLERHARGHIENRLWLRKAAFEEVCLHIENDLRQRGIHGREPCEAGDVRMFWAERDGNADAVRIKHTYGFDKEEHLDDRLVFPFRTSMTAWAMETGLSQFAHEDLLKEMLSGPMNRYRRAVRWSELRWCWAIPISKEPSGKFKGVLAIESNIGLGTFDDQLGREGAQRSARWKDTATGRLWEGDDLQAAAQTPTTDLRMPDKERVWATWMENEFLMLRRPGDVAIQLAEARNL